MGQLADDGVIIIEQVVSEPLLSPLRDHFSHVAVDLPGARGFDLSQNKLTLISNHLGSLARSLAGQPVKPVRILFFDKTPDSNWSVPWHQDRTIAVKQRYDVPGFGPWSVKNGVAHVEPPVEILESMLTLRLFVDDCGVENGPLEVARGSHRVGRIAADQVKEAAAGCEIFIGIGRAGDVLAMKLLAIHRSKRSAAADHRRVLHIDYASQDLPSPLEWAVASDMLATGVGDTEE
jgi:Phytanoyl-CoA dioxygenase (PhyH)